MLEKKMKAAGRVLQDSQQCLASVLWTGNLGGSDSPGKMGFEGGMSGHQGALLFRLRPAHRAAHGQYLL
jgi:hypothetical protein